MRFLGKIVATIGKMLHDWLTGPSNKNFELGRFLWILFAIAMIGFSGMHLYMNGVFDVLNFGLASGGLLAAGGFGISQKDKGAAESLAE